MTSSPSGPSLSSALVAIGVPNNLANSSVHVIPTSFNGRPYTAQLKTLSRLDELIGKNHSDTMLICSTPTDLLAQMQAWSIVRRNYKLNRIVSIMNISDMAYGKSRKCDPRANLLIIYGAPSWDRDIIREVKSIFYQNQSVFKILVVGGFDPLFFQNQVFKMSFNYMVFYGLNGWKDQKEEEE